MERFKYQPFLERLEVKCPPKDFDGKDSESFRWVFDTIEHEDNFKPQFFKKPKRFDALPHEDICQSMGLSFFSSEQFARTRFNELFKLMAQKAYSALGTKLAKGIVLKKDGVSGPTNEKGHFTFYVYENADLVNSFKIIGQL